MYTLEGKTWPTHHVCFPLQSTQPSVHFLRAVPVRDNLSLAPTKLKQAPTPERSIDNQIQTDPTIVLGGLILPPMWQPWSRGERFLPNGYTTTSAYWDHITNMQLVRSILAHGVNPSILNQHRRGLQPLRCRLATYPLPDLPNQLSPLSPNGSARSPV
jgi:hypothetical protein